MRPAAGNNDHRFTSAAKASNGTATKSNSLDAFFHYFVFCLIHKNIEIMMCVRMRSVEGGPSFYFNLPAAAVDIKLFSSHTRNTTAIEIE